MSQNVVKVGVASAIGAAVFCVVALVIAPVFTWYSAICGALVGGLVGYMGYEFRTVMLTVRQTGGWLFRKRTRMEQVKTRYLWSFWVMFVFVYFLVTTLAIPYLLDIDNEHLQLFAFLPLCLVVGFLMGEFPTTRNVFNEKGGLCCQKGRWIVRQHLRDFSKVLDEEHYSALCSRIQWVEPCDVAENESWRQLGVYQLAPTTWNMLRMRFVDSFINTYLLVGFCLWLLSRIPNRLIRIAQWVRSLFRRIHSHQRVVCAESSIIGGMFDYVLLVDMSQTLTEKLFLVALGSVSGFVVGVLLWKIALSWRASEAVPTAET